MDILSVIGLVTAIIALTLISYYIGFSKGILSLEKDYSDTIDSYEKDIDNYYIVTCNLTEENERLKEELNKLRGNVNDRD